MRTRSKTRRRPLSPRTGQPLQAVEVMSAQKLHEELVLDAVAGHATELKRAVAAYERIGRLRHCGPEKAYQDVSAEVQTLTGRGMPVL